MNKKKKQKNVNAYADGGQILQTLGSAASMIPGWGSVAGMGLNLIGGLIGNKEEEAPSTYQPVQSNTNKYGYQHGGIISSLGIPSNIIKNATQKRLYEAEKELDWQRWADNLERSRWGRNRINQLTQEVDSLRTAPGGTPMVQSKEYQGRNFRPYLNEDMQFRALLAQPQNEFTNEVNDMWRKELPEEDLPNRFEKKVVPLVRQKPSATVGRGYAKGGHIEALGSQGIVAKGSNPNTVDGVDLGRFFLDHDEAVYKNFAYPEREVLFTDPKTKKDITYSDQAKKHMKAIAEAEKKGEHDQQAAATIKHSEGSLNTLAALVEANKVGMMAEGKIPIEPVKFQHGGFIDTIPDNRNKYLRTLPYKEVAPVDPIPDSIANQMFTGPMGQGVAPEHTQQPFLPYDHGYNFKDFMSQILFGTAAKKGSPETPATTPDVETPTPAPAEAPAQQTSPPASTAPATQTPKASGPKPPYFMEGYEYPGLTPDRIMDMQKRIGVKTDGIFGPKSYQAMDAWNAERAAVGVPPLPNKTPAFDPGTSTAIAANVKAGTEDVKAMGEEAAKATGGGGPNWGVLGPQLGEMAAKLGIALAGNKKETRYQNTAPIRRVNEYYDPSRALTEANYARNVAIDQARNTVGRPQLISNLQNIAASDMRNRSNILNQYDQMNKRAASQNERIWQQQLAQRGQENIRYNLMTDELEARNRGQSLTNLGQIATSVGNLGRMEAARQTNLTTAELIGQAGIDVWPYIREELKKKGVIG